MKNLTLKIEKLISENSNTFEISKVFKSHINSYIDNIDSIFDTTGGKDLFIKHTKHTDKFLILMYKYILSKNFISYQPLISSIPISLVALGSYGREQLCIYSDIDIMILYENVKGYNLKEIIEEFITFAWDCGLTLGSRVHEINEIEETVKKDITIKSSIIESRLIFGSKTLWHKYEHKIENIRKTNKKEFITEKLEEHRKRLIKYPLNMEPNIKKGYGGIRESNMIFWFVNVIFGITNTKNLIDKEFTEIEYKTYRISLEFIFRVRNALHIVSKKKQDQITFDILPDLSTKLGFINTSRYTKERQCMSKVLTSLHNIHNFSAFITKKISRKIILKKENILILRRNRYSKNLFIFENTVYTSFFRKEKSLNSIIIELINLPKNIDKFDRSYIYYVSKTKIPKEISKELKRNIKKLLQRNSLYPIIKLFYNAKIFHIILPITKNIIDQPQFDGYHKHPTDIHSIKTLKIAENIKEPYIKEIFDSFSSSQKVLIKLVALFHDVGKGRIGDHHKIGEKLFKKMLSFLNFDINDIKIGARLVRYHNMMSYIATHEDIYSQKVILNFTGLVKTNEILKMLLVITYSDISAVKESLFNSSISLLLKQLYLNSIPAFENKNLLNESTRRFKKQNAIKNLKKYTELPTYIKKKINYISSNQIFLQLKADDILDIVIKANTVDTYIYKIINNDFLTIRIIRKVPLNLGYLLGKLEFLNISSMNIFKLFEDKKAFEINFSEKINDNDLPFIKKIIEDSFQMDRKIKTINKPKIKKNEIKIDCNHTTYLASMQIKTKDQKGMFAYIAKIFDDFNIDIETAKIHTLKGYARDLILIEKNGNFCSKQDEIIDLICEKNTLSN